MFVPVQESEPSCDQASNQFQITFKIRESMKNFEGSIALVLSKSFILSCQEARLLGFLT